jgi:hypothetical protein
MPKAIHPDVALAIRSMRDALNECKQAVHSWRDVDEGARFDVANGMLILLGEIVADKDGEDTQDVVAELLNEHAKRLMDTPPQGHALAHAIGRLGATSLKLNKLVRE